MTGGTVAELKGVGHRYGRVIALDDVSAAIPAGCMAGLIGPDGVGKSTLFSLIAGSRVIPSGTVEVLGGDKRAIFSAAAHAQRAVDYLKGLQPAA